MLNQGCKSLNPYMERNYIKTTTIYNRDTLKFGTVTSPLLYTSSLTNSLYLFPHRYYSDSSNLLASKLSEEEKIIEEKKKIEELDINKLKTDIFRKEFPLVFPDMSKIKEQNYYPIIKQGVKYVHLFSLKGVPGIYMITNNITKKYYIGMSTNLYKRFNNYLDVNRLKLDGASRINKALLKHGFENFSISILEFNNTNETNKDSMYWKNSVVSNLKGHENISNFLRKREDFFIKVLKPQYNIKTYIATRDLVFVKHKCKVNVEIPLRVKNLLDKCLDPNNLDYNFGYFTFKKTKRFYAFSASTPNSIVKVNSSGWFEGRITDSFGFEVIHINNKISIKTSIRAQDLIEKEKLAEFYTDKGQGIAYVKDSLKRKLKALKAALLSGSGKSD